MTTSANESANKIQKEVAKYDISAWVSASAGSGKTKVLVDRLLNLLLNGAKVDKIWCITYTKAGASEMIDRINRELKNFAVMDDDSLEQALLKLNIDVTKLAEYKKRARALFAEVLDAKSGLRITTIHGLSQSILKRFPVEAKISPYFSVLDEMDGKIMFSEIMKKLLNNTYHDEYSPLKQDLCYLIKKKNRDTFNDILETLLSNRIKILDRYELCDRSFANFMAEYKKILDIDESKDFVFYIESSGIDKYFVDIRSSEIGGTVYKEKLFDAMSDFERDKITSFNNFADAFLTKENTLRKTFKNITNVDEIEKIVFDLKDREKSIEYFKELTAFFKIAIEIITCYQKEKQKRLVLDYDDLIILCKNLLGDREVRDWVLYRLDNGLDHLLIDEAQDTSPEQWQIIKCLSEEFLSGDNGRNRTIFVVGDRKQSIFSFQGAKPDNFDKMRHFFKDKLKDKLIHRGMAVSFRSNQGVIDLINYFLKDDVANAGVLGEETDSEHIVSDKNEKWGSVVELWPAVIKTRAEAKIKEGFTKDRNKSSEINVVNEMAIKVVKQIKALLDGNVSEVKKEIKPSDIMILLKDRGRNIIFINQIVKLCKSKEYDIPIIGLDRFAISENIVVKDLINLGKFLLSPFDDLSLAEVLKSPLFNLNDDDLSGLCVDRKGQLYEEIKEKRRDIYDELAVLLNMSLNVKPYELYSYILDGKTKNGDKVTGIDGRKRFMIRFGDFVDDILKEFLSLLISYEKEETPSLFGFIRFINNNKIEIKREADNKNVNAVRIMTVHASKGLQSEVVFLPDTGAMPSSNKDFVIEADDMLFTKVNDGLNPRIVDGFKEKNEQEKIYEYHRLLYVAISRAKSMLYIGARANSDIKKDSWYLALKTVMQNANIKTEMNNVINEEVLKISYNDKDYKKTEDNKTDLVEPKNIEIPDWVFLSPNDEPTPAKPLSPSQMDEDDNIITTSPSDNFKFKRGLIIHKMLEIFPEHKNIEMLKEFLEKQANDFGVDERCEMLEKVIEITKKFPDLFGENSKSEIPLIGMVENKVYSAQIDRMVITKDKVVIVDYKTNRFYKDELDNKLKSKYFRQINIYKRLMQNIYPKKEIKGYILWTEKMAMEEVI